MKKNFFLEIGSASTNGYGLQSKQTWYNFNLIEARDINLFSSKILVHKLNAKLVRRIERKCHFVDWDAGPNNLKEAPWHRF